MLVYFTLIKGSKKHEDRIIFIDVFIAFDRTKYHELVRVQKLCFNKFKNNPSKNERIRCRALSNKK